MKLIYLLLLVSFLSCEKEEEKPDPNRPVQFIFLNKLQKYGLREIDNKGNKISFYQEVYLTQITRSEFQEVGLKGNPTVLRTIFDAFSQVLFSV